MARRPPRTLVEVAAANLMRSERYGSIRAAAKAAEAISTVAALAIAAHRGASEDGTWPTQQEYARYWKVTERTAQREWAHFRKAFPDEASPDRLARWLVADYGRRLEEATGPSFALTVVPPSSLTAA